MVAALLGPLDHSPVYVCGSSDFEHDCFCLLLGRVLSVVNVVVFS